MSERKEKYEQQLLVSKVAREDTTNEVINVLKNRANEKGDTRIDLIFGDVMAKHDCPILYTEWILEIFWGNIFSRKVLPHLDKLYKKIVKNKVTYAKRHCFNDLNDHAWYEPHKEMAVLCHTTQNINMIYMWQKSKEITKVHIRRFWDEYKLDPKNKFSLEENNQFKKLATEHGRAAAIRYSWENWSDEVLNNLYPHRPSLNYYRERNFVPQYQDFRDFGYITTWDSFHNKVQGAHSSFCLLKLVIDCFFGSLCSQFLDIKKDDNKEFTTWPN